MTFRLIEKSRAQSEHIVQKMGCDRQRKAVKVSEQTELEAEKGGDRNVVRVLMDDPEEQRAQNDGKAGAAKA